MQKVTIDAPRVLSWILAGLFFVMPIWLFVAVWLGSLIGGYEIWRSLPVGLILAISFAAGFYLYKKDRKLLKRFLTDKINLLIIVFGLIIILSFWLSDVAGRAKLAGLAMDGRFFLAFLAARALALLDPKFGRAFLKFIPKFLVIAGVILAILGIAQVTFLPRDFLMHFGYNISGVAPYVTIDHGESLRAFAMLAGPNNYANYLLLTLFAAVFLIRQNRGKMRVLFAAASFIIICGLIASSSRAAWLAGIFGLAVYFFMNVKISKKLVFGGLIGLISAAILGLVLFEIPTFRENILHIRADRDSSLETSNDAHLDALVDGLDQLSDEPLGCGVGCAGPASYYAQKSVISENYYLQLAQEYSVVGAALFVAIFALISARLVRKSDPKFADLAQIWFAAGLALGFAALFAHTFTDEAVSLTWFIAAGGLLGAAKLPAGKS